MRGMCANPASPLGENDFFRNQTGKLGMGKRDLASFFKNDLSGFGSDLSQVSRSAEKGRIGSGGLAVPDGFAALAKAGGNQGVFWVDGRQSSVEPLWVEVLYDSRVICSNPSLPVG